VSSLPRRGWGARSFISSNLETADRDRRAGIAPKAMRILRHDRRYKYRWINISISRKPSSTTRINPDSLLAIMLGRLQMNIDDCTNAYISLSDKIFQKRRYRVNVKGQVQGRFNSDELKRAVKEIVVKQDLDENTLLKDFPDTKYKM
jgi:hypothetical protein